MMSIDQLLNNTASFEPDHKNAMFSKVTRVHKITPNVYRILTLTRIPRGVPGYPKGHIGRHVVVLKDLSGTGFTNSKSNIEVSCECDRFKFMWEWALSRQGAAQIIHSNGAAARLTNPRGIPCACKHVFLALLYIKSQIKKNQKMLEKENKQKQRRSNRDAKKDDRE